MHRNDKPKISACDLVKKLKDEKGIKFNITNETDAAEYIKNINNDIVNIPLHIYLKKFEMFCIGINPHGA